MATGIPNLRRIAMLPLGLIGMALGACSPADNEQGPGGVTAGEARALDEAAQMLDSRRVDLKDLQPSGTAPADQAEAPAPEKGKGEAAAKSSAE